MFSPDNDPHHLHPNFNEINLCLIIAFVFVGALILVAPRLMNYLEECAGRRKNPPRR